MFFRDGSNKKRSSALNESDTGRIRQPLLPDVGILSLGPDNWSDLWQPRHQIMSRLSRYYHVVWMNPARDVRSTLKHHRTSGARSIDKYPGLTVFTPPAWLPLLYRSQSLADFTFRSRLKRASDQLGRLGVSKKILYMWRPNFLPALGLEGFDASCYHVDDEYTFSDVEMPIDKAEERLLSGVSQVFVHSPGLLERKGGFNPNTQMVTNGVDFQAYSRPHEEPADLAAIPHPRIGYTGWLKRHLDWQLLLQLSERHPDWSFVLVGPTSPHREIQALLEEMKRRRNVYFLGPKPTDVLPKYPQHFDVCLMPYAINDYTKYIYPLKLHEYLAAGRPTVGTRIRTLESFSPLVSLAIGADDWSEAVTQALRSEANTPQRIRERQSLARQHDWDVLVRQVAYTIARRLGPEYIDRFESIQESVASLT